MDKKIVNEEILAKDYVNLIKIETNLKKINKTKEKIISNLKFNENNNEKELTF